MAKYLKNVNKKNKVIFLSKSYLFLILIASVIMSIGYASVNLISASISGEAIAAAYRGVLITNVELIDSKNATATIDNYFHSTLATEVVLSDNTVDSYVTYRVTFYNNTTSDVYFYGIVKDDLFYTDLNGAVNKDIIYFYDVGIIGTKMLKMSEMYIEFTFKYSDSVDESNLNNTLHSYLNFDFGASENLEIGENLLDYDTLVGSSYIDKSGNQVSYSGWSSSDYIPVSDYNMLIIQTSSGSLDDWNAFYDADKKYIKNVAISKLKTNNTELGVVYLNLSCLVIPDGVEYLRISASTSELYSVKIYPIINDDYNKLLDLSVSGFLPLIFDKTIYDVSTNVANTYINKSNGGIVTYSGWSSSDYIDVSEYSSIAVTTTGSYLSTWNAFYDVNKSFISSFSVSSVTQTLDTKIGYHKLITIPTGVKYIRVSESNGIMNAINIYGVKVDHSKNTGYQIFDAGDNIFDVSTIKSNVYIGSDGKDISYSGWSATDFIDISQYDVWAITGGSSFLSDWNAVYDENKNFIKTVDLAGFKMESKLFGKVGASMYIYIKPSNVKYIRFSEVAGVVNKLKVFPIIDDYNGIFSFEIIN